jgi:DNA-binding NtrC family response regulator
LLRGRPASIRPRSAAFRPPRGLEAEPAANASGGHDVLVAKDVAAGIAVLNEAAQPIDLLISDAIMPGRSVLDLIDAYENTCPAGAILICSGHINEDLLKRGIQAGDYSFLAKPFEPEELLTAVDTVLAEGSLQRVRHQNIPE